MDISYLLLRRLPLVLFALAGILIALIRWKRHPKVSVLTILGMLLLSIQSLTFMFVYYLLPRLINWNWSYTSINYLYTLAQVCQDVFFSVVIILLVVAAFSDRQLHLTDENKRATPI